MVQMEGVAGTEGQRVFKSAETRIFSIGELLVYVAPDLKDGGSLHGREQLLETERFEQSSARKGNVVIGLALRLESVLRTIEFSAHNLDCCFVMLCDSR